MVKKDQSGWIYLITSGDGRYKIGRAKDYVKRLSGIQTGNPDELFLIFTHHVSNAEEWEDALHLLYNEYNIRREWFNLSPDAIKRIIELLLSNENPPNLSKEHVWNLGIEHVPYGMRLSSYYSAESDLERDYAVLSSYIRDRDKRYKEHWKAVYHPTKTWAEYIKHMELKGFDNSNLKVLWERAREWVRARDSEWGKRNASLWSLICQSPWSIECENLESVKHNRNPSNSLRMDDDSNWRLDRKEVIRICDSYFFNGKFPVLYINSRKKYHRIHNFTECLSIRTGRVNLTDIKEVEDMGFKPCDKCFSQESQSEEQ